MKTPRLLALAGAILFMASRADAVMSFDSPKILNADPDNYEGTAGRIAGNGVGTWLAIFGATNPPAGQVFSRSTDDGLTWSAPAAISAGAFGVQSVAVSDTGTCIGVGVIPNVLVVRSTDSCATWSGPVEVYSDYHQGSYSIATDSAGHWVVVVGWYNQDLFTYEAFAIRSDDDGLTWSAAVPLGANGSEARVATDGNGTWVAYVGASTTTSTDNGATWTTPVPIGMGWDVDLAGDGAGNWILTGAQSTEGYSVEVFVARSSDDGGTWSTPVKLVELPGTRGYRYASDTHVRYRGGAWQILWTEYSETLGGSIGREGDIVGMRSFDGGLTWSDVAAVNINASYDNMTGSAWLGLDTNADVGCSPDGTCILLWDSVTTPGGLDYFTSDVFYARSHQDCPSTPATGCHVSTTAGASRIKLQNRFGGKDKLKWKWRSGEATTPMELGNPTTTTDYVVCLYEDVGGTMRSVFESDAAAGGTCTGVPCWKSTPLGYLYSDEDGKNGPLRNLTLETGADGDARLEVRASGAALAPPPMPFAISPSVIAQVINLENGQCWESAFSDATNTATQFKARSD